MIRITKIAQRREYGECLGRAGISERIIELAEDISEGSYKNAIEKAGQIAILVDASTYDDYWDEKAMIGTLREERLALRVIESKKEADQ